MSDALILNENKTIAGRTKKPNLIPVKSKYEINRRKDVDKYSNIVANTASEYLDYIVSRNGENIKYKIFQKNSFIFLPDKTIKNNLWGALKKNIERSIFYSGAIILSFVFLAAAVVSLFVGTSLDGIAAPFIFFMASLIPIVVSFNYLKELKFMMKTGYKFSSLHKIDRYHSKVVAITDQAIYLSGYFSFSEEDGNGEIHHSKYIYKDINYFKYDVTANGWKYIEAIGFEGNRLFSFRCQNDEEFNLVFNELETKWSENRFQTPVRNIENSIE